MAKGRLADVLPAVERKALAEAMLARAVAAAGRAPGVDGLLLVGTDRMGLSECIELLGDPGNGLNAALDAGRAVVAGRSASRIVSLAADLPLVCPEDVTALCSLPDGVAAIAPDRHGTGTNALSLPFPAALGFTYGYGPGSCARHKAEAARLGLDLIELHRPGLARDVDEPDDLVDAKDLVPGN